MKKRWIMFPEHGELRDEISVRFEISRMTAQVLLNRGVDTIEKVEKFLNVSLNDLHDPFLLGGMHKAVDRILDAVNKRETVIVHGDYDVDGITSTALISTILKMAGTPVHYYIPNRAIEGYGLGEEGISFAERNGAKLLITVDCGINSVSEVTELNKRNIDVIVTDHHIAGPVLPPAVAVVNPNLPDSAYPFKQLAGVGVSFKLVHGILKKARERKMSAFNKIDLREQLDLVALGTISDMMPLIDENRIFVKYGLKQLTKTQKIGLQQLKKSAFIPDGTVMETTHISFLMAPRLNSIGRLREADLGVDLLTAQDAEEAEKYASVIEDNNRDRQRLEEEVFSDAKKIIDSGLEFKNNHVLVVAKEGWAVGIVSIVASRLTREYHKPAIVFSIEDGIGRGSARSIKNFDMLGALHKCKDFLQEFGGHSLAAGLSIHAKNIDVFTKKINEVAGKELTSDDLVPEIYIDSKLRLIDIGDELIKETERLAPFGEKNRRPVFLSEGVSVQGFPRCFGRNHIKFVVEEKGFIQEVIAFNMQECMKDLTKGDKVDIVYSLNKTHYTGIRTIQLQLLDAQISQKAD
ncbi:single-stranded-DNA-specific exonuclease RecJ [bacterium]|nr:single-stranded-DNA-specific exonuclease RecJ [bacterium]